MTDKDKITAGLARVITRQQKQMRALREERDALEGEIARLERLVCAIVRWHFAEGGSEPELLISELDSDEPPSECPFEFEDADGVRTVRQIGRVLR